jgi:hypothetical protein
MPALQFYTRKACSLCHSALAVVKRAQRDFSFQLDIIDIDENPDLSARYGHVIPVVACGETELARSFIDEKNLRSALKKIAVFD